MFNTIISLFEKHGFLAKVILPKLNLYQFKYGPVGLLLMEKLKHEWLNNIVINKDISVFMTSSEEFANTYDFASKICMETLPFGIAEVQPSEKINNVVAYYEELMNQKDINFKNLFENKYKTTLKCTIFSANTESISFFHQFQRQRRIWWRKFSPNPGRYSLTDIKINSNGFQSVEVLAKYPWNFQVLETITLNPSPKDVDVDKLKFKHGKRNVQAHTIVSEIDTTTMFLNAVCDAYDDSEYKGIKRTLVRFHRKLAPYSISFAVAGGSASVVSELNELALYLTKQLRTNLVSTLLLPSSSRLTLEAQWKQYDELGIPFNILLNEKTLKDGIALLRSRETTLKEQIHVTELVTYVEKLFKNY